MNTPVISVVIPIYNGEKYFDECMASVVSQTIFDKIEIILVDDGSKDSSPELCDKYCEKYENVRVIHQQNAGVSAARNAGIDASQGEFIGFIDCDDTVNPEMYERLLSVITACGADMSFCALSHGSLKSVMEIKYPFSTDVLLDKRLISEEIAAFMLHDSSLNSLWNKLFRRELLCKYSLRLTIGKKQGEDRELVLKYLAVCNGVCYTDYVGYFYRLVTTSAVQAPRYDYTDDIFNQHDSDRTLYRTLGIEETAFEKMSEYLVLQQIIGAVSFAYMKFRGAQRQKVLKSIVRDVKTQSFLKKWEEENTSVLSLFEKMILKKIQSQSIQGLLIVLTAMKLRALLHEKVGV